MKALNINHLYDRIPHIDAFLDIAMENGMTEQIFPEYQREAESCICIYGVSETDMDAVLEKVFKQSEQYVFKIDGAIEPDTRWDIQIKTVFLFENKECAVEFIDFANALASEDFFDFILELDMHLNEAWVHAKTIDQTILCKILEHYKGRYAHGNHRD